MVVRILADRDGLARGTNAAGRRSTKRKGGAEAPPPCAMSSLTPVRDDHLGAARPFGLWITRPSPWSPMKRQRDPGLGPLFYVAWLRRDPNLGQIGTGIRRLSLQRKEPHRLHLTALRQSRQAVAPCARSPPPPLATRGNGQPWAC